MNILLWSQEALGQIRLHSHVPFSLVWFVAATDWTQPINWLTAIYLFLGVVLIRCSLMRQLWSLLVLQTLGQCSRLERGNMTLLYFHSAHLHSCAMMWTSSEALSTRQQKFFTVLHVLFFKWVEWPLRGSLPLQPFRWCQSLLGTT